MTIRTLLVFLCLSGAAAAQTPQPAPKPVTPPATTAPTPTAPAVAVTPRREGQPINIKVDVTITDQRAGAQSFKKTVSVVTADGLSGFIRSTANYVRVGLVPLNVDVEPFLLADGKVRLRVNLQYDLPVGPPTEPTEPGARNEERRAGELVKTQIQENLAVILENGKPLVVAQSADPVGDRQVTIEVKATILR